MHASPTSKSTLCENPRRPRFLMHDCPHVRILALLGALALCGCAQQQSVRPGPNVNLSGYSPEFKQGYADGCASAQGSPTRDAARFRSDAAYARGWQDGKSICGR
jgi:hypothetical protein